MLTPKDFQFLSDDIFQQLHQTLSPSTLKRLWGYFPSVGRPRQFTLDILGQYVEKLEQHVLVLGQTFANVREYLQLFGVTDGTFTPPVYWSQSLPHHLGIILWGPEFQHPEWHNQGDASRLMPTITEWWTPLDAGIGYTERNADNYLRATSFRELRITFMKNLTGGGYTFLGIYRLAPASSPRRLVWQRLADRLDLRHLEILDELRNDSMARPK